MISNSRTYSKFRSRTVPLPPSWRIDLVWGDPSCGTSAVQACRGYGKFMPYFSHVQPSWRMDDYLGQALLISTGSTIQGHIHPKCTAHQLATRERGMDFPHQITSQDRIYLRFCDVRHPIRYIAKLELLAAQIIIAFFVESYPSVFGELHTFFSVKFGWLTLKF